MINLHKNLFIKVAAVALTLIFAHQQLGWTENGRPVWANSSNTQTGINIPYDIGQIHDKLINGSTEKIIHIQDAHSSLAAQESITNILGKLVSDYDVSMIAIEGADGRLKSAFFFSISLIISIFTLSSPERQQS